MSASWAAVAVSASVALFSVAALIYRSGRREGKLDAVLADVAEILKDHEQRIRGLEVGRHRRPR